MEHQFGILNNCVYNKKVMEAMSIIFFSLETFVPNRKQIHFFFNKLF